METNPKTRAAKPKKSSSGYSFGVAKEKEFIIENLSMLLSSGLNIVTAIESIKAELKSPMLKNKLDELVSRIDSGLPLWRALDETKLFSANTVSLIRLGEETGRLSDNLKVIASQQQKDRLFKSRLRSAMAYPVFVLSLTFFIGLGMAWFILPNLANVLNNLRIKLPLITRLLINFGLLLRKHGRIAIPLIILVFGLLVYFIFVHKKGRALGRRLLSRLPGISRLIKEVELARFGFVLGTLLKSGLTITQALESLVNSTTDTGYQKFYTDLKDSLTAGNSFQKSFNSNPDTKRFLPLSLQQIIIAAEQSGNLALALLNIGQRYEEKSEISSKNITVLLEPIMLFIVWIGVLFMALAIILPIYSLIGGFNP